MIFKYGIFATIKNIKCRSVAEVINAIQRAMELSPDIEITWDREAHFKNVTEQINSLRQLRIYEKVIDLLLKVRWEEIKNVYYNEYYSENIELTEIPMESQIFHWHNFIGEIL